MFYDTASLMHLLLSFQQKLTVLGRLGAARGLLSAHPLCLWCSLYRGFVILVLVCVTVLFTGGGEYTCPRGELSPTSDFLMVGRGEATHGGLVLCTPTPVTKQR